MKKATHNFNRQPWLTQNWRYIGALVYFAICFTDFVLLPMMLEYRISALLQCSNLPELQTQIQVYLDHWEPLTLNAAGIFHLSFGAILGGSSILDPIRKRNSK